MTELEKSDRGWRLVRPVSARADERAVHSLLRALGAPLRRIADKADAAALKTHGLVPPAFEVTAVRGTETLALRGGSEDPFDGSVAIQKVGDPALYALPGGSAQAMAVSTYGLRERAVLLWREEEILAVRVVFGARRFEVRRAAPRTPWMLTPSQKAGTAAIVRALSADLALRFLRFEDGRKTRGDLATAKVTWIHRSGAEVTLERWRATGGVAAVVRVEGAESTSGLVTDRALSAWDEVGLADETR